MEYFGNSTNVASTTTKTVVNKTTNTTTSTSRDETQIWKSQQVSLLKRNAPKEDPSDPTPLLIDKISSLPMGSARRKSAEAIKSTLDGTAADTNSGMDSLTRESYKEIKRLTKQSYMLQKEVKQPLPSENNIFGSEEGQRVSNIQDWRPMFINANKPVSDAIGSHSDTEHSIIKDAGGSVAFLPLAATSIIDGVGMEIVNETEGAFKINQLDLLQHLPSKITGSVRQLSTALDSILSVPFEIASDVYNGLMLLIDEISNLIDGVLSQVMNYIFGILGGLADSIFPDGMLEGLIEPILEAAGEIGELFALLGGVPAISTITGALSNISGSLVSVLRGAVGLANLLTSGSKAASYVGGLAGKSFECTSEQLGLNKINKFASNVSKGLAAVSAFEGLLGSGIGNLGSMIKGGISNMLGSLTSNKRNFADLLSNLLPASIGKVLNTLLGKLCSLGMVGNQGYSIGNSLSSLRNNSFSKAMQKYATHYSIIAPLFGKQHTNKNGYAQESYVNLFENSRFAPGAQGHKGITMMGPGGSVFLKPFGLFQGSNNRYNKTYSSNPVSSRPNYQRNQSAVVNSNMSYIEQTTILNTTTTVENYKETTSFYTKTGPTTKR